MLEIWLDTYLAFIHQKLQLLEFLIQHILSALQILIPLLLQLRVAFRVFLLALYAHPLLLGLHLL